MKFKNIKISVFMAIILMYFASASSFAATSAEIKNTIKIQRMGGYVISINYETHDAWTDNLFLKCIVNLTQRSLLLQALLLMMFPGVGIRQKS